ncbi:MAG: hypothetical protein SH859_14820 [Hyphomicrobium aestuarii]|nr:hypothetical protein [Hyphomicrobium aestuarii]
MTSHFVDKERAFVDGLEVETGRSLGVWMIEIEASGLTARNDIIDWLRQRGFTFAKASWLERIHHNGGALIYAGVAPTVAPTAFSARFANGAAAAGQALPGQIAPARSTSAPASPIEVPAPVQTQPVARAITPAPQVIRAAPPTAAQSAASHPDVGFEAILAQGKAYRPLAQVLLREILAALPGTDLRLADGVIVFEMSVPFCAMAPGPKGVRLDMPAGCGPSPLFQASRSVAVAGLTASALLTDARQIDDRLLKAIADAARRTD